MAVSLKHSFTSAKADDADTTLVRPSNWNAEHTLTLATAKLLGRATAAAGAAEEVGVGTSLVIDAATTTLKRAALTGDVTATEDSNATSIASGAATLAKLDRTGTSGQLLTAQGVGSAPIWAAAPTSAGSLLRAPQILTSGTSYTTPANCTAIYVEVVGGGGGGGGGVDINGGGGSGAYAGKYFSVSPTTAYTYSIGAGGTAGSSSGGAGGTGGSSTFVVSAVTVTSAGGVGGTNLSDTAANLLFPLGGTGGTSTNGDVNIRGNPGANGIGDLNSSGAIIRGASGNGGASFFGGAGRGVNSNIAGVAGLTGSGGSGAYGGTVAGGAGGAGIIRVWEYS